MPMSRQLNTTLDDCEIMVSMKLSLTTTPCCYHVNDLIVGAFSLLENARLIGNLAKQGYRPQRSIAIADLQNRVASLERKLVGLARFNWWGEL